MARRKKSASSSLQRMLEEIASDTTHGASELYLRLLGELSVATRFPDDLPDRLRRICGDMAPFIFLADELEGSSSWKDLAWELLEARRTDINLIAEAVLGILPEKATLFCHSRSGTVLAVLEKISSSIDRVFQTISEPGEEGRDAHQEIENMGIQAFLVDDGARGDIPSSRAIPLLGADAVTTEFFVNKIGSARITATAVEAGVPVYVVASREKLIRPELYEGKPRNVELFERVPLTEGVYLVTPGMKDTPVSR